MSRLSSGACESDDKRFEQWGLRFDHPKPTGFATDIVSWFSGGSDIVMDFFAGSGTTGHATWMANARDGGTRSLYSSHSRIAQR